MLRCLFSKYRISRISYIWKKKIKFDRTSIDSRQASWRRIFSGKSVSWKVNRRSIRDLERFAQFWWIFVLSFVKVDKARYNRIFVSRFNNGLWFWPAAFRNFKQRAEFLSRMHNSRLERRNGVCARVCRVLFPPSQRSRRNRRMNFHVGGMLRLASAGTKLFVKYRERYLEAFRLPARFAR